MTTIASQVFRYIYDWACPYKRFFYGSLGDFGVSFYDILVFVHWEAIVAQWGPFVAFSGAFLGAILTLLKIVQVCITLYEYHKGRWPGKTKEG